MTEEERKERRRETYRTWVAANRDKVRAITRRAKQKAKAKNPDEWRRKNRERGRAWNAKNPEKRKLLNQEANLKRYYGMTVADYDAMFAAHDGKCAICKRDAKEILHTRLYVDHNHATGVIRGLLCYSCNSSLGQFGDSIEGLQRVINYLLAADQNGKKIA